jgi:hypothetical protein
VERRRGGTAAVGVVVLVVGAGLGWWFTRDEGVGHGSVDVTVSVSRPKGDEGGMPCASVSSIDAFGGKWVPGGVPDVDLVADRDSGRLVGEVTGTFVVEEGSDQGTFTSGVDFEEDQSATPYVLYREGVFSTPHCWIVG